jgi:MerR family transcriptional regulator, thiopeptide resistance regulator
MNAQSAPLEPGLLKIGEFARKAGTNLRTLRYYEEIGLLVPAARSKGGFRFYRESDANRLKMVQTLQRLGLHLSQISEVMSTRQEGKECDDECLLRVHGALEEQDRLLEKRVSELQAQRKRIHHAIAKLRECEECEVVPGPENNFCDPCPGTGRALPEDLSALL